MKKQTFLKGSIILGGSALIAKLLGAAFKIPLTNLLGGTGMGYFSCAYGLFLPLYAVLVTGLSTAVAKPVAVCAAKGDFDSALRIRSAARRSFFLIGLLGTAAAFLCAAPFTKLSAESREAYPAVLMIAPAILMSCLTAVERGYCEGLCNMYPTGISQAAEALVKLLSGLLLCHLALQTDSLPPLLAGFSRESIGAAAAVLGVTLSTAAGWLCMLPFSRRTGRRTPSADGESTMRIFLMLLRIMIPVALGALASNLTSLIDLVTVMHGLRRLLSENPADFYAGTQLPQEIPAEEAAAFVYGSFMGLSVTIFNLVPSLTNMFAKSALPCAAQAIAAGDQKKASSCARQSLLLTAIAAIPAGCGIFVLSEGILRFLYPSRTAEIAAAAAPLQALAPGVICLSLVFPVFSLLQAAGRADLPVKIMLPGIAVKLLGNLLLLPQAYMTGAAAATSLCYLLILILALYALRRVLGFPLQLGTSLLRIGYAGAMCAAAAWLMYDLLPLHGTLRFLLALGTAAAVYAGLLLLTMGKTLRGLLFEA